MEAWLSSWFGPENGLAIMFVSGFLAATLLPGGSEAFLFGLLKLHPHLFWQAIGVATLGNTLGGLVSYGVGRFLPEGKLLTGKAGQWLARVQHHGSPILLLAWAPWIGDALCVAAGWLRLNVWWVTAFMAIGKFARFWVTALAAA
jgi:membrane protein YqaA with SNARE-associated domain